MTKRGPVPLTEQHRVYWGSHGCKKRYPHERPCRCTCGEWYKGTHVYGEDMETAVSKS